MRSITIKLYLAAIVAASIITVLLIAFFFVRHQERRLSVLNPREAGLAIFLVREIEQSPDQETVDRLAENFGLFIRYEGPEGAIQSNPDFFQSPRFLQLERRKRPQRQSRRDRRFQIQDMDLLMDDHDPVGFDIRIADRRYVFVKDIETDKTRRMAFLVAVLVLTVLGGLGFLVKRWLADPLRKLEDAIRMFPRRMEQEMESLPHATGDLKRLFDAFSDMKQQVREALDDRDRLLRDVSHDLKSPMTRMRVAVELLPPSDSRDRILADLEDLGRLVNRILESRQLNGVTLTTLDMRKELTDYLDRRMLSEDIRLHGEESFAFSGDRDHLWRVFDNLMDNSRAYADIEKGLDITVKRKGNLGLIRFRDHGEVLSTEVVNRIFEPFFRADPSRRQDGVRAYGLGLAICRGVVNEMKGNIQARPATGGGLEVDILFPVID